MTDYRPPVRDMHFLLTRVLGFNHPEIDAETALAVMEEAAKLASGVLAPLNKSGDQNGAKLKDGAVTTAPGFKEAYKEYREGGWNAVPFEPEYGGQGLPWALAFPIQEMWQAANMAFGLCPLLNQGAVEALLSHGAQELKDEYLPKLISGEWTGTMNLTEPQAGSDLGLLRAKAERAGDGSYKITGQKIFITYGEHDLAENIIHLVLARLPDAPEDVKGISLFIVPKFLSDGGRNAVQCIGLEHKLGIHGSPTCTMEFTGAKGFVIGKENEGLKYMFTMMNNARLSVGLQGVAIAERATQHALAYAQGRVQGKSLKTGARVSIDHHADVKRMLLTMQAMTQAGRALAYDAAMVLDAAHGGDAKAQGKVEVMTPIVKSWCTDMACDVASIGVQVHGGMGFIEETGAAQYYRDARILPIYEGTNGIQAADLAFRKTLRDNGAAVSAYIAELEAGDNGAYKVTLAKLREATEFLLVQGQAKNMETVAAAAAPYLKAFGIVAGGVVLGRCARAAAKDADPDFAAEQKSLDEFFRYNIQPQAGACLAAVLDGSKF